MRLVCVTGAPRPAPAQLPRTGLEADLRAVNEDLFAAFGARWDDPPVLPDGWEQEAALEPIARRAGDVLAGAASAETVVWEDPLTSFLLPFWGRVAAVVAAAVVVTDPDDTVTDLTAAEAMGAEQAAELWLRYLVAAWRGAPHRAVVAARDLRARPDDAVAAVVAASGADPDPDAVRSALSRAATTGRGDAPAPPDAGGALKLARAVADLVVAPSPAAATPVLDAFHAGWLAREQAADAARRAEVAARVKAHEQDRVRHLDEEVRRLRRALAEVEQRWAGTARAATLREEELAAVNRDLRADLRRLHRELEDAARAYDRLRSRRAVQVALAVADAAKPVVAAVRRARTRGRPAPARPRPHGAEAARVFPVVLNYRSVDDTLGCLGSLAASTARNQFPVVVDNASGGDDLATLAAALGPRTLIDAGANLGYGGGNNLGIRHALEHDADFVWVLNPDARVEPDTLARLLTTAAAHPDAGIVGGRVLNGGSDPATIGSDGGLVDWAESGATDHLHAGKVAADLPPDAPYPVDYVTGAAMLVRRAVFDDIGFLPEEYFLYFEETDFCLAAAGAGWRVLVDPAAAIWHLKRSHGRLPTPYYVYYFTRNRIAFARKHGWEAGDGALPPDLERWVGAWRQKVERADPAWVEVYEDLVGRAVADGHAGVRGPRGDIDEVPTGGGR